MKRSDRRRIDRGLIICDKGHWFKLFLHGKMRNCPRCTVKEEEGKRAMLLEGREQ